MKTTSFRQGAKPLKNLNDKPTNKDLKNTERNEEDIGSFEDEKDDYVNENPVSNQSSKLPLLSSTIK